MVIAYQVRYNFASFEHLKLTDNYCLQLSSYILAVSIIQSFSETVKDQIFSLTTK